MALRLHFQAWCSLVTIRSDFDAYFDPDHDPSNNAWSQEWSEYLEFCQSDLESILTLIQQSNELALKAKICRVSPFLLLLKSGLNLKSKPGDVDFSDLKTLDATDLPGAVNTFCDEGLSENFIQTYNEIRSLRNKIAHLGKSGESFELERLFDILVFQYVELWKERAWLEDRVNFSSQSRSAFFHDGKYSTAQMDAMLELPDTLRSLSAANFKKLFGRPKKTKRYLCHACFYEADPRGRAALALQMCQTAFLDRPNSQLSCTMCGEQFKVEFKACCDIDCKGKVLSVEDRWHGKCHVCGQDESDLDESSYWRAGDPIRVNFRATKVRSDDA